ncbi:MAG: type II toxin-antitoxin system RelE/ParE family toxin [Ignavibacteria bacterium]|nr:type II toxin-antitoxin system RelE/ParE family toxin [Ignavibacteria bacterium]
MKYKLLIRSCAEQDITEAVLWYEKRLKGLGARFLFSVDATIQSIQRNPRAYPKVYKNYRRALLQRFPHGIYYLIKNEVIIVIAVYHEKRNPEDWMKRT